MPLFASTANGGKNGFAESEESPSNGRSVIRSYSGRARLKWGLVAVSGTVALALDFLSKKLILDHLPEGSRRVLPFLSLERTENRGVAFGLLEGQLGVILVAAFVALLVVVLYLLLETRPVLAGISGGVLLGGSLGNLVERLSWGKVTDFIKLPYWPTFNLADVFIVVGVALVALNLLLSNTRRRS